ncbi:hypothetical protein C4E44_29965 [Pseudomonas sp. MWU12-2312b]|nr:hypothetical protein C4E44_29965 [Pseudomonas sp. MWU12-2312b]
MVVNDNACLLDKRVVLEFIASGLAPTGGGAFKIQVGRAPPDAALFCARAYAKQQQPISCRPDQRRAAR